jgi:hypothetical protein
MVRRSTPLLLCLLLPLPAAAQTGDSQPIEPPHSIVRQWDLLHGELLRVSDATRPDSAVVGHLVDSRNDSLFIQVADHPDPVLIVAEPATKVETWSRHDPTRASAMLGGFLGMVGGVAVGAALFDGDAVEGCRQYDPLSNVACTWGVGASGFAQVAAGAIVGATVGALVGHTLGRKGVSEGWRPVNPVRARVRPGRRGQLQLGLEIRH